MTETDALTQDLQMYFSFVYDDTEPKRNILYCPTCKKDVVGEKAYVDEEGEVIGCDSCLYREELADIFFDKPDLTYTCPKCNTSYFRPEWEVFESGVIKRKSDGRILCCENCVEHAPDYIEEDY